MNIDQYHVVEAKHSKLGAIIHEVNVGEETKICKYSKIYGGLAWATFSFSACYQLWGEEYVGGTRYEGQEAPRGKLRFFVERRIDSLFLEELFRPLADDCTLYLCTEVFANLDEEHEDEAKHFQEFVHSNKINISLAEPPYSSLSLRLSLLKQYTDKGYVDLPEGSGVRKELQQLTRSSIEEVDQFPSVLALSHVIAGFHRFGGPPRRPFTPKRTKRVRRYR